MDRRGITTGETLLEDIVERLDKVIELLSPEQDPPPAKAARTDPPAAAASSTAGSSRRSAPRKRAPGKTKS